MKELKLVAVLVLLALTIAYAGNTAYQGLIWILPTHNVSGTPLTDLAGVRIYYGTSSSNYTTMVEVGITNKYTVLNLLAGRTYYFNGTAYNSLGMESDYANEVSRTIEQPGGCRPLSLGAIGAMPKE